MIYHLNGELVLCDMTVAVIDCGGVGYKLLISGNTLGKISGKVGEKVKLFTYMKVSEDAVDLYGFADEDELETFKLLISVSGVGAKFALSILSLMTPSRLAMAIGAGDAKAIAKAQGVGPKIAQRIILELKDKVAKQIAVDTETGEVFTEEPTGNNMSDAIDTLIVLGYKRGEAVAALKGIDPKLPLEEVIRLALKKLAKQ